MSIPGGFPRNGVFSGSKTFNIKKFFLERYLCRGRAPNEHFMSKPAPKRGYPYFDSISLLGECPIFSGAQNVESNFRCHNENLTQHSGHRKKLGTRRAAKSNQNRGTPTLGQVLTQNTSLADACGEVSSFFSARKFCGRSLPEGGCPFLGDSPGMAFFRGVRLLI